MQWVLDQDFVNVWTIWGVLFIGSFIVIEWKAIRSRKRTGKKGTLTAVTQAFFGVGNAPRLKYRAPIAAFVAFMVWGILHITGVIG